MITLGRIPTAIGQVIICPDAGSLYPHGDCVTVRAERNLRLIFEHRQFDGN